MSATAPELPRALAAPRPRRRRPGVLTTVCAAFLGAVALLAITGAALSPHAPNAQDLTAVLQGPSASHWLGTDQLGRDVLARVMAGARDAVIGPLAIALASMALGGALGLLAGYRGGWVDAVVMRWVDVMLAVPALLVAIVVIGVVGGGYWIAVVVLAVLTAPFAARLIRGVTLEQRPQPYVEAAEGLMLSRRRILFGHILPNVLPIAVANTLITVAISLVTLSSLSFLGLGSAPGTPDWGRMLAENIAVVARAPAASLAPAVMIVLTAVAINLLGDSAEERMSQRGRS